MKKQRKISELSTGQVVHCPTEESAKLFCKMMDQEGLKWRNGETFLEDTEWVVYKKYTCYHVAKGSFADLDFYKRIGYEVIPVDEFIGQKESIEELWSKLEERIVELERAVFGIKGNGATILVNKKKIFEGLSDFLNLDLDLDCYRKLAGKYSWDKAKHLVDEWLVGEEDFSGLVSKEKILKGLMEFLGNKPTLNTGADIKGEGLEEKAEYLIRKWLN